MPGPPLGRDVQNMDVNPAKKTQKVLNILEWLKTRIKTICTAPRYCALCLASDGEFYSLNLQFTGNEAMSMKPLREVVNYVFNLAIDNYVLSNHICEECAEKIIEMYIFITNTKKTFEILKNCVNDMNSKVNDINNTLDENVKYEDSNVMIVIECDNESYEKIHEVTTGNNAILTNRPIPIDRDSPKLQKHTPISAKPNQSIIENKENKSPVVIATPRVIKNSRTKEVEKEDNLVNVDKKVQTPNYILKDVKIVIESLSLNNVSLSQSSIVYPCKSCTDIFTTRRSLQEHDKVKHNTKIYKCNLCNKLYAEQKSLDIHYLSRHFKSRCKFCNNLFASDELNSHLKEQHGKFVFSCEECELFYYTDEKLETHVKSSHLGNPPVSSRQCIMCLKYFNENEMASHKCRYSCLECPSIPCIHHSYLMSYRVQVMNRSTVINCKDCHYTVKSKNQLMAHVNKEHLDYRPFTCNDCGAQFYSKLSLKQHIMRTHLGLKCPNCNREFKYLKVLQAHSKLCKSISQNYVCEICSESFNELKDLQAHIRSNHTEYAYPCSLCYDHFPSEKNVEEHHARIHIGLPYERGNRLIECTICDIIFQNVKLMVEHEKEHSSDEVFPCKVCLNSFTSLKKVYLHKQRHYSQKMNCPGCKKNVAVSNFKCHKVVCPYLGTTDPSHKCEVCGKLFHLKDSLKCHMQSHQKRMPCIHCGKLIKPASMKKHIEVIHPESIVLDDTLTRPKLYLKCSECDLSFKRKAEYENHINKIHLKIKPYRCDVCGKEFCGKLILAFHMKTHSKSYSCICYFCGKKFANRVCLKMHLRRHTGENRYECNICLEKFCTSSLRNTHRIKKHEDKTISCPLCDAMYHLVSEMRLHVKRAHWKRPEPFDYRKIVSEEHYHLFQDRRMQKLGKVTTVPTENGN